MAGLPPTGHCRRQIFYPLAPGRFGCSLKCVIPKCMFIGTSCEIALRSMPQNTIDDKWTFKWWLGGIRLQIGQMIWHLRNELDQAKEIWLSWDKSLRWVFKGYAILCQWPTHNLRDHFVYAPSHWETMLHCNVVSHWLGAYTKWSLNFYQAMDLTKDE